MSLDKDTVRKIAFLARIRVPAEALDGLSGELSNIIGWVEQLNEVDTKGVEPMTSVADMDWPRRDDEITDGDRAALQFLRKRRNMTNDTHDADYWDLRRCWQLIS